MFVTLMKTPQTVLTLITTPQTVVTKMQIVPVVQSNRTGEAEGGDRCSCRMANSGYASEGYKIAVFPYAQLYKH